MRLAAGQSDPGGDFAVAADIAFAWRGTAVPCSLFLLGAAGLTAVFCVLFRKQPVRALKAAGWMTALLGITAAGLFLCWRLFAGGAAFEPVDEGKHLLYGDRKVMLIVPHQDDDINVLGGVMEEYVRYGSDLYPVFVTNGDYEGLAEIRFREVLDVMAYIGVPEENVIFLGYGDTWAESGPHLYNAQPDAVLESYNGHTKTYGTQAAGAYREGRDYTLEHLLEDLESVILEYRPDTIFCSDYDAHIDHKAVSMAFEKVMGKLLKENPDYRPAVFKGYAYSTAWYAEADFYELNILSTRNVFEELRRQTPAIYRWEDRVRLPVWDGALSRSLLTCRIAETLGLYVSQEAQFQAARVVNGDKVFWYRDTGSLCLDATVKVSSGEGSLLNDFMLAENLDLKEEGRLPEDGTWIPEDPEKIAAAFFSRPVSVGEIRLYDNPSPADNVLSGVIVFDDGDRIPFGPLDPEGAAAVIPVDKSQVTAFTVQLLETEGQRAGLTEMEAFAQAPDHGLRYLKLTDSQDNFVYDYWIPEGSEAVFGICSQGLDPQLREDLKLEWDSQKCWAGLEEGKIRVIVPQGKTVTLTVSIDDGTVSDTVRIHNPGPAARLRCRVAQLLEREVFQKYCDGAHRNSAVYKLLATALDLIR